MTQIKSNKHRLKKWYKESLTLLLLRSYWDQKHLVSNLLVFRPAESFVRQPPKSCAAEGDECTWDNVLKSWKLRLSIKHSQTRTELSHPNYARRQLSSEIVRKSTPTTCNNLQQPIRPESTPRHMPRFPVSPRPRPNGLLLLEPLAPREALFAAARNFEPNLETDMAPKTVLMFELWTIWHGLSNISRVLGATLHYMEVYAKDAYAGEFEYERLRRKHTMRADGAATFPALVSQSCIRKQISKV